MNVLMDSSHAREEHEAELSARPESQPWDALRKTQSAVSNGFIHRWAARRIPEGALVLDAACGDGRLARLRGSDDYVGIDFLWRLARRASRFSGAPTAVGDLHAIPVRESSVDVVTCFEVMEHLEGPAAAMEEMARLLRAGGLLLLSVPNDEGLKHRLKRDPHPLHQDEMDASKLRSLVEAQFTIESISFRGVWLLTPGRVSVQVGLPASRRIATNILVIARKQ